MKARITGKSELKLSDLTREYTFDVIGNEGETVLISQSTTARPNEITQKLESIIAEYQTAYEYENDLGVGDEI